MQDHPVENSLIFSTKLPTFFKKFKNMTNGNVTLDCILTLIFNIFVKAKTFLNRNEKPSKLN